MSRRDPLSASTLPAEIEGFVVGLLVGEGHFGGDGRRPHLTLRMHARHEDLFRRLAGWLPGSAVYGPYHHGGRHYVQWMLRGEALRATGIPLIVRHRHLLDGHTAARFDAMCRAYCLGDGDVRGGTPSPDSEVGPASPSAEGRAVGDPARCPASEVADGG